MLHINILRAGVGGLSFSYLEGFITLSGLPLQHGEASTNVNLNTSIFVKERLFVYFSIVYVRLPYLGFPETWLVSLCVIPNHVDEQHKHHIAFEAVFLKWTLRVVTKNRPMESSEEIIWCGRQY